MAPRRGDFGPTEGYSVLKREGGELTILANREEIERLELDITSISLVVQGGSALFEGLHWR